MPRPSPPFDFALTCDLDTLEAQGFGMSDIRRYISWTRGEELCPEVTDAEIIRFGYLAILVILADVT